MPKEYIYEPWTAPLSIQNKAKCIIGRDYPKPGQFCHYYISQLKLEGTVCVPNTLLQYK